jgi:apolipoprotein N-acyltransferase
MSTYGGMGLFMAILLLVLLMAYLAVYFGVFAWAASRLLDTKSAFIVLPVIGWPWNSCAPTRSSRAFPGLSWVIPNSPFVVRPGL